MDGRLHVRYRSSPTACPSNNVVCSRISVDTRLHHMFIMKIDNSFWNFGNFPPVVQNGSEAVILTNPWVNGTKAAPFDQRKLSPSHDK
jgi:hypothetical protein